MHAGSDIRRQTLLWMACLGLCGLQACSASPYGKLPEQPPYGQAYRATLKAQELPPRVVEQADGLPFLELEQGLQSQQTAKPAATIAPRNGRSPSGLIGP